MILVTPGARTWRVVFALAVGVHLLVLYLPAVPEGVAVQVAGADKAVHVVAFAAVMGAGVLAGIAPRWLALVLALHAGVSELIQHLVLADRQGEWADVLANLGGVALGWYLAGVVRRRRLTAAGPAPSGGARPDPPPSTLR